MGTSPSAATSIDGLRRGKGPFAVWPRSPGLPSQKFAEPLAQRGERLLPVAEQVDPLARGEFEIQGIVWRYVFDADRYDGQVVSAGQRDLLFDLVRIVGVFAEDKHHDLCLADSANDGFLIVF